MSDFKPLSMIGFFLFSFFPFFIIVSLSSNFKIDFKYFEINLYLVLIIIYLILFILTYFFFKKIKNDTNHRHIKIREIKNLNDLILNYILTYVFAFLPLFIDESIKASKSLAMFFLFIILMLIYIRTNLIYLNPIFIMLGLNIFQIIDENGNELIIISKKKYLIKNENIKVVTFNKNVLVDIE